jgi:hypothetical protein
VSRKKREENVVESMKKELASLFKDPRSEEAKLLQKRDRKRKNFRTHRRAYTVVVAGLMLLNILPLLIIGGAPAWAFFFWFFPALLWGMGFAMHGLSYRAWLTENSRDIVLAERKLGLLPSGKSMKQLPPPKDVPVIEGVAILDEEWQSILAKAKQAIARALDALQESQHQHAGADELRRQLSDGMANIERLAAGAERITDALSDIAPDGGQQLEEEIDSIDAKINDAADDQLREVYLANRSLLVARKAKLEALHGERARMKANAEGFLLAAENVRLDIAGMTTGEKPKTNALVEPVRRLTEEVEILRKVEAELKQFG